MVDETIDGRERHGLVREDLVPFAERLVGRDQHGSPLEQHARFGLILGDVGEIIEDEQMVAVELGNRGFEGELATSDLEPLHEIGGAGEHHAPSILDQGKPKRCRQMALAAARWAEEEDVGPLRQPSVAGRQRHHLSFRDHWHGLEVERGGAVPAEPGARTDRGQSWTLIPRGR